MKKIYFDNSATSFPKSPGLGQVISDFIDSGCLNINRSSYQAACDTQQAVFETRKLIADFFDCPISSQAEYKRIVFTPSVTYSLNYFIRGLLSKGDHVIVSSLEHHAVMRTLTSLSDMGISVSKIPCDKEGNMHLSKLECLITEKTKAVIIIHASNVCGTINPITEIGEICKKHGLFFAVDCAQSAGVIPISIAQSNIDFLAFTGHKGLLSIQGIGGFIISERLSRILKPTITGGTGSISHSYEMPDFLPDRFESGTLNLSGIIGLKHSITYINQQTLKQIHQKEMSLCSYFIEYIKQIEQARIIGRKDISNRIAVVSLDFPGHDNSEIAFRLDSEYNIMTRVGLHCAPSAHEALGTLDSGTLRFSFGSFNTHDEIDYCIKALKEILA